MTVQLTIEIDMCGCDVRPIIIRLHQFFYAVLFFTKTGFDLMKFRCINTLLSMETDSSSLLKSMMQSRMNMMSFLTHGALLHSNICYYII